MKIRGNLERKCDCVLNTMLHFRSCYPYSGKTLDCFCMCWLWLLLNLWVSDVNYVLSSTALLILCRFMHMTSFMESFHLILGLSLFLLPSISPSFFFFFQKNPPFSWCAQSQTMLILLFLTKILKAEFALWLFWQFRCL